MATILDKYREKQSIIQSQISENSLPPEELLQMQELNYRVCVLETFQAFCKSAPITMDTRVMGYHFQLVSHVGYYFAAWIAYADSRQKLVLHTMPVL